VQARRPGGRADHQARGEQHDAGGGKQHRASGPRPGPAAQQVYRDRLRQQVLHEPAGVEKRLRRRAQRRPGGVPQRREGRQVRQCVDGAEAEHEAAQVPGVEGTRAPVRIGAVEGQRQLRDVEQQVLHQNLHRQHRQERQRRTRRQRRAHVADVGRDGDFHVLDDVAERVPRGADRAGQDRQVLADEYHVAELLGDLGRAFDAGAHVGGVQGRYVVDAVAEVPDGVPGRLQRRDDAGLLPGVDAGENGGTAGQRGQCPRRARLGLVEQADVPEQGQPGLVGGTQPASPDRPGADGDRGDPGTVGVQPVGQAPQPVPLPGIERDVPATDAGARSSPARPRPHPW